MVLGRRALAKRDPSDEPSAPRRLPRTVGEGPTDFWATIEFSGMAFRTDDSLRNLVTNDGERISRMSAKYVHDRRSLLAAGVVLATGSTLARAAGTTEQAVEPHSSDQMSLKECIQDCLASHAMCLETARYCMEQGGRHVSAPHLALLLDCAEMCQTTANSMLRQSPQHTMVCAACARLCEACALDCDAFRGGSRMQECAATCRACARSCRDMASMSH